MKQRFELDARLQRDCHVLGSLDECDVLLHRNAGAPWFILVPHTTQTEIIDLPLEQQQQLLKTINQLGGFVRKHFEINKLNIAAIGNIVSQLHVHVVGRNQQDYCWPDVVWGRPCDEVYSAEQVECIAQQLADELGLVRV